VSKARLKNLFPASRIPNHLVEQAIPDRESILEGGATLSAAEASLAGD